MHLSAAFRTKTQVFPLDKSDFIRTRLTHSLEVSSFGKSLGQNIGENILTYRRNSGFTYQMKEDISHILECAGLIHDIGIRRSDISGRSRSGNGSAGTSRR